MKRLSFPEWEQFSIIPFNENGNTTGLLYYFRRTLRKDEEGDFEEDNGEDGRSDVCSESW